MNLIEDTDEPRFAAFAALDWGDRKHAWSLQPVDTSRQEQGEIEHTPEAVEVWAAGLNRRFGGQPVAIAVEQARGPLVFMLSKYSHLHVYPVHPRAASQFRAALVPSGAKDDPTDAQLLLEMLVHHRDRLRPLQPDTPETRRIQHLVEARRKLVNERTRQSNRLTAQLKLYFPQMLDWFSDIASPLATDLLRRWPTLEALQRARPATVRSFFTSHNCRSEQLIQQRMDGIRSGVPALKDEPLMESAVAMTAVLIALITALRVGIADLDSQIARAAEAHPDFAIFHSLPGAGPVLAPRLLAAFGAHRQRYGSAADVQTYSGIAPVTERSGKSRWIHVRRACPRFLRQTFHEWAAHSITYCDWAAAFYQLQRSRGKDHHAAVRVLAFKWIRIAFRCWRDRVLYDNNRHLLSLRQHQSPLLALLDRPASP